MRRRGDYPLDDQSILPETEPPDDFGGGPSGSSELHLGGLKPPHRRTIKARLEDIDLQRRARRCGEQKIVKATTAVLRSFEVSRPLEVVQIDHTKADIFVVDEETRLPTVGRG